MKKSMLDVVLEELSIDFREFVSDFTSPPVEALSLVSAEVTIITLLRQVRNADLGSEAPRVLNVLKAMRDPRLEKFQLAEELEQTIREVAGSQMCH